MKFINRITMLVMGCALLIIGGMAHTYLGNRNHGTALQQRYSDQTKAIRVEIDKVYSVIQNHAPIRFDHFQLNTTYPYYVYRDGELVFWSHNYFVPNYKFVSSFDNELFFSENGADYVLIKNKKRLQGHQFEVVVALDLIHNSDYKYKYHTAGYNPRIFFIKPEKVSEAAFPESIVIRCEKREPVFHVRSRDTLQFLSPVASPISVILVVIGTVLVFYSLYIYALALASKRKYLHGGILMVLSFVVLRLLMRYFNLPWIFFLGKPIDISYGNLFIDTLCLLIVLTKLALVQYRTLLYFQIEKLNGILHGALSLLSVLATFILGQLTWWLIDHTYQESLIENHYSVSFYLSNVKDTMYVYLFILLGIYFLGIHSLANFFRRFQPYRRRGAIYWAFGTLLGCIMSAALNWGPLVISSAIFMLAAYLLKLPRYFYRLRSFTYMYYIFGALAYSLILFNVLYSKDKERSFEEKRNFADNYLKGKDPRLERQIVQVGINANKNQIFKQTLEGKMTFDELDSLIKDYLFQTYLDRYLVTYDIFDSSGTSMSEPSGPKIVEVKASTIFTSSPTDFHDVFLTQGDDNISYYTLITDLLEGDKVVGTFFFRLYPNRSTTLSLKSLLQSKRVIHNPFTQYYSYGIYDANRQLIYQFGSYNYRRIFDSTLVNDLGIYEKEAMFNGYTHFALKGDGGKVIVVSEKKDYYLDILSNFSFLFFVSMVGMMALLVFMGFFNDFKRYQMDLSGRIQLYLNGAFLLPLTIIMIIGVVIIKSMFASIREESMLGTSQNISEVLNIYGQNYEAGKLSRRDLRLSLDNLSRSSSVDINLYDLNGILFYSSALSYYDQENPTYPNPQAFASVLYEGNPLVLQDDFQQKINVKTAFLPVKGNANNVLCVAGINFIDSQTAVESWTRQIWKTLLITFMVIFIFLYIFSFISSKKLTEPLKLIAMKIKEVNFHESNEEIVWETKDEIGLLTNEYNRMLKKLEQSKQALSISEKQSAWREMAKQLAHEIRNPLTPMLLSVQHLQRLILSDQPEVKTRMVKILASINEQIEKITGISMSFSRFAEMQLPTREEFNLVSLAMSVTDIFKGDRHIDMICHTDMPEILVKGDSKAIKKAVAFVIRNGINSVPPTRRPEIHISVSRSETSGIVQITDNGMEYDDEMLENLFRPSFTEKDEDLGFGLSVAKMSIEYFGGNVWYRSEGLQGKTCYIQLPLIGPDQISF
jgi:two-component system nitrogen regulation sensor histidine kinase NtrY